MLDGIAFYWQRKKMVEVLGWHQEIVDMMETSYRAYLSLVYCLMRQNIDFTPVPNRLIDEFWHMHILDTEKYFGDCQVMFGGYMHHYPYFGMEGDDDEKQWVEAGDKTNEIWVKLFTVPLRSSPAASHVLEQDAYALEKEHFSKLSQAMKDLDASPIAALGSRCRTCRAARCP
ncbi:hypothetical protein [Azospirillum brasilense]|uniref:hypothetical protein n=1 Tax=Azospirillum brasilense TaxID=192 RepID=UPI0011C387D6|nr:hypothetical protein [Azospirillum brasilense]NUB26240.1 hypothetical protein [Azospirillum brasilense]NUB34248.1 hypothetical protein [Azospirillum brasilense]